MVAGPVRTDAACLSMLSQVLSQLAALSDVDALLRVGAESPWVDESMKREAGSHNAGRVPR